MSCVESLCVGVPCQGTCKFGVCTSQADLDGDGVANASDNCADVYNPGQRNADKDAFGSQCDCDDSKSWTYPGAKEVCTDVEDNDCDGKVDCGDEDCAQDLSCLPDFCETEGDAGTPSLPCSADHWCWESPALGSHNLWDVWGCGSKNIWAVGDHGAMLHWRGNGWVPVPSGTTEVLRGVWGSNGNNVWAVGMSGSILRWNTSAWSLEATAPSSLMAVWGSGYRDVWAVGAAGTTMHWNGESWSLAAPPSVSAPHLTHVAGTGPSEVWAWPGGLKWNGAGWAAEPPGVSPPVDGHGKPAIPEAVYAAWPWEQRPDHRTDVYDGWVVGWNEPANQGWYIYPTSSISYSDGTQPPVMRAGGEDQELPTAVWASAGSSDVWVVGYGGYIQHLPLGYPEPRGPNPRRYGHYRVALAGSSSEVWVGGDQGQLFQWNGTTWAAGACTPYPFPIRSLWQSPSGCLICGDSSGFIMSSCGATYNGFTNGLPVAGLWGSSDTDVWAVTEYFHFDFSPPWAYFHYTAGSWQLPGGTGGSAIYGTPAIWVVGTNSTLDEGFIKRNWAEESFIPPAPLSSVWGSSDSDVWAVGKAGTAVHWNGASWNVASTATTADLMGVRGLGPGDVWAVGTGGTILHWNGSAWSQHASGTFNTLRAIAPLSSTDVFVAGDFATLLRYRP